MRKLEKPVIEVPARERADGFGERLRRRVSRAVVRDDDLGVDPARAEKLRACGEARRDSASLVVGRKN